MTPGILRVNDRTLHETCRTGRFFIFFPGTKKRRTFLLPAVKSPADKDRVEDCYNFAILCNDTYGLFRKMIEEVVDPEALRAIEESEKEEYAQRLFAAPENAMMAAIALRGLTQTRQD